MSLQLTFERDHYEERVRKQLDNLLLSDFLLTDPYCLDDASLEEFSEIVQKAIFSLNLIRND